MTQFALRRLAAALPTLIGITLITFLILNLLPTDPLFSWSPGGPGLSAEASARLRSALGPERGVLQRYADWLGALLRLDLGTSVHDGRPVVDVLRQALPWSLLLNLCAIVVIYALAIPLGLIGATAPGRLADRAGGFVLLLLYAMPSFAAALLLQQGLAVHWHLLPLQGVGDPPAGRVPWWRALDLLRHLILPVTCQALAGWAFVSRYARAVFTSTLRDDFLATVRAKGAPATRTAMHLLANAAVPLVGLIGAILPGLVGGSVLIEQIFSWPGLGRLYVQGVETRDYPVVLALTLLSALAVLAGQISVDLLYLVVDPRMRDTATAGPRRA